MTPRSMALRALVGLTLLAPACSEPELTAARIKTEAASAQPPQHHGVSASAPATDPRMDTQCAQLSEDSDRSLGVRSVLANQCSRAVDLSVRDVHELALYAETPEFARTLLQRIGRWGDNESTRLVSVLLATQTLTSSQGSTADTPSIPSPNLLAVIPLTDAHLDLASHLYAVTNDPAASAATKTRAHAALATMFLQVFDSLGVRDTQPLPPLTQHVAARFLRHGRAFALAHLHDRVAGLHPSLLRMEPQLASVVQLLAGRPMGGADGSVVRAWIMGHRYLQIAEVRDRLRGRVPSSWRTTVQRLLELRMLHDARMLLAAEFPRAARDGALDRWLHEIVPIDPLAPLLRHLADTAAPVRQHAGELDALPEALTSFEAEIRSGRRAQAETLETALIQGANGRPFAPIITWTNLERELRDNPDVLRRLIQRAGTTPALRPYHPALIDAARRVSLRPALYQFAQDTLGAAARDAR